MLPAVLGVTGRNGPCACIKVNLVPGSNGSTVVQGLRRLFSDRFFTSSFRPEFYTHLGIEWVLNNGPLGKQWEMGEPNGHRQQILPMKRLLLRNLPELADELKQVVNAFDPWARARGEYYTLDWAPRSGAETDLSFRK
jgi:hypothetical protein